ncbi:MAG: mannonate dehydratase [Rhizobiales bacterium 65-9]|nr:mannonate dehydratase [Hyphomicrobiales bacterium]OJY35017.1 MAG: mannonate dehydratase [Rhizobiales bacterium 65-9]
MEETWRWFGPADNVRLDEIRQTGATGVVTALHEIPYGEIWPVSAIEERQKLIAEAGLVWSVVESLPIHEAIKINEGPLDRYFDNYRASLRNLAACGVRTICYNFMPVLDWTRTNLSFRLPNGASALRFDAPLYAAFDCLMLQRPGAEAEQNDEVMAAARAWHDSASESDKAQLLATIMAGLPGAFDRYDLPGLRRMLERYRGVDVATLRANYTRFLKEVVPTAEEHGLRLCVHPDDPPRPLLGLPRIVSSADDLAFIVNAVPSPANGITFCTGSLGAGPQNDVPAMARRFARHVHFAHLRNTSREADGSFYEADHLGGDTDMIAVIDALLEEDSRRRAEGAAPIPFRPDHGHVLLSDAARKTHPGYTLIGRMKGLAELRGVIAALSRRRAA